MWYESKANDLFRGMKYNLITPSIIDRRMITPTRAIEVSIGTGFYGKRIYGVTVVDSTNNVYANHRTDLGACFYTLDDAEAYAKTLETRA